MGQIIRTPFVGALGTNSAANNLLTIGVLSGGGTLTPIYYPNGTAGHGIQASIIETPNVRTITPTASNSALFAITITQFNRQTREWQTYYIPYETGASGDTATTICNNFRTIINRMNVVNGAGSLNVTVSGSATLIITGGTGDPLFFVNSVGAGAITDVTAMTSLTSVTSDNAASPYDTFTKSAHGLVTGEIVDASNFATDTAANGKRWRVVRLSSSTFALQYPHNVNYLVGSGGSAGTAGIITLVPQEAVGSYAQVAANIPLSGTPAAASTYSTLNWIGIEPAAGNQANVEAQNVVQVAYFDEADGSYATNVALLQAELQTLNVASAT